MSSLLGNRMSNRTGPNDRRMLISGQSTLCDQHVLESNGKYSVELFSCGPSLVDLLLWTFSCGPSLVDHVGFSCRPFLFCITSTHRVVRVLIPNGYGRCKQTYRTRRRSEPTYSTLHSLYYKLSIANFVSRTLCGERCESHTMKSSV